jgi:kumamolisin
MPDDSGSLVQLAGSERAALPGVTSAGPLDTSARVEVTLVLRRRAPLPEDVMTGSHRLTRDELAAQYGASPDDIALVSQVMASRGLEVTEVDPASRRVKVAGTLADLTATFGTTLQLVRGTDPSGQPVTFRYRQGALYVPAEVGGVVTAVLGLDTRPTARAHFRARAAAAPGTSYLPNQVADIYQFPAGTTGAGQTVAVIELGGGFSTSDLDTYFGQLGLPVPSVTAVGVDGGANAPGSDPDGADIEVALDVEVIGSVAPGAAQVVYFAPNNGDQGFVDAISVAAQASPTPIAMSISWGESEDSWTAQGLQAMDEAIADAAALGITVCVAAGDNGSSDAVSDGQPHCDFPASSPHALGCGGTTLLADPTTGAISSEVVWNETASNEGVTGGGVSDQFALPSWQAEAGVPARADGTTGTGGTGGTGGGGHRRHRRHWLQWLRRAESGGYEGREPSGTAGSGSSASSGGTVGRGVPDVAGNADPTTGYQILSDGQPQVVGGTSAVAPMWAGLIARLAEATGQQFGLIQTQLYVGASPGVDVGGFNDITSGNNGAYSAGPGWDACSGLGSPSGTDLLARLED